MWRRLSISSRATFPRRALTATGWVSSASVAPPFTLASYMIEGGSSRNYIETKRMMYGDRLAWPLLMEKLVEVLVGYAAQQVEAGADVIPDLR